MRVCYTCVNRHYLTISKGVLVLWSVLGWLSLHPQRVQCVSSVAPEATGRGSRFPSGHRGSQGVRSQPGLRVFPQEKEHRAALPAPLPPPCWEPRRAPSCGGREAAVRPRSGAG